MYIEGDSQAGKYTIQRGYSWLKGNLDICQYGRWVWNKKNIPKHSFIYWLTAKKKLLTKYMLDHRGINLDTSESINHLFYECKFSKLCLDKVF